MFVLKQVRFAEEAVQKVVAAEQVEVEVEEHIAVQLGRRDTQFLVRGGTAFELP